MPLFKRNRERHLVFRVGLAIGIMASLISILFCESAVARGGPYIWPSDAQKKSQATFMSPEGAVNALIEALSANDEKKLLAILGPKGKKLIFSGDKVDDRDARERLVQAYREKNRIIKVSSNEAVLEIGNEDRPFPIRIEIVG